MVQRMGIVGYDILDQYILTNRVSTRSGIFHGCLRIDAHFNHGNLSEYMFSPAGVWGEKVAFFNVFSTSNHFKCLLPNNK